MKRKNPPGKQQREDLSLDASSLPLLADGEPPKEFRVFRAGVNDSDYGPILFDAKAAEMVMAEIERKGNPLFFDWNHGSELPKEKKTRDNAASAGEFKPFVRDGELWVACEWNEDGFEDVKKRRYNLFSPTFPYDDTDGEIRPCGLSSIALLNRAGLDHLNRIAAGARLEDQGDDTMDEKLKELQAKLDAANEKVLALETKNAGRGVLALSAVLGLAAAASDEDRVSAVKALVKVREDVLALASKASDGEALGVLRGWKENAAEVATIKAEAAEKEAIALTASFDGLLDKAVADLKVAPAEKAGLRKAMLSGTKGVVTAEGVAELTAYLETRQPMGKKPGEGPKAPPAGEAAGITAEQKSLLKLHSISLESAERALENERLYLESKAAREGRTSA